ncbi:HEAT repeat domain-containing protein [Ilumatobacter sp.]|uniref:HEAT repeat domain-containing protein n=1 Tax=Ilumatobacter sp. TaxID=1967498 RepID=UPI003B5286F0
MLAPSDPETERRRRSVAVAGHRGDAATARAGLSDPAPQVRAVALGALERLGSLPDADLAAALADPHLDVRRRAAEISAGHPSVDLLGALADDDPRVVEIAAWACGEHESRRDAVVERLVELATTSDVALVRESAIAALGAIGDPRGLDAIVAGTRDKPAVRRRAVLALAPFVDHDERAAEVAEAIARALEDRDWQVRQSAEDLDRAL